MFAVPPVLIQTLETPLLPYRARVLPALRGCCSSSSLPRLPYGGSWESL